MSTTEQLTRLQNARNTIRNKMIDLGLSPADSQEKLDALATKISGIQNQGAVNASITEGKTYTIPAGYHNGTGTVVAMTDAEGDAERYQLQVKTVTPTKDQISVTADSGYYGLSGVTVEPIPNKFQDISSVTATPDTVLANKVFVNSDGDTKTGTMANNGAVSQKVSVATPSYTIPAGYHNGSGTVSIDPETKTVTPTEADQVITPTVGKVLSSVSVAAIPKQYADASAVTVTEDKLLTGTTAIGYDAETGEAVEVTGTMADNGAVTKTLDTTTTSYTVPQGYHNGEGAVSITLETKPVTPTKSEQTVTPASGKVLSSVKVAAIPANFIDTTDADAAAENILAGKTAYVDTVKVEGTMRNNGAVVATMDGLTTTSYTIPQGYHDGTGTVSLTSDIETALAAI